MSVPVYLDGCIIPATVKEVRSDDAPDFPERVIIPGKMKIWYRAMAIYDRTRLSFCQQDKELTMKIRIPYWDGIHAGDVVMVDGDQQSVFNASVAWTQDGVMETELTLISPAAKYKVVSG